MAKANTTDSFPRYTHARTHTQALCLRAHAPTRSTCINKSTKDHKLTTTFLGEGVGLAGGIFPSLARFFLLLLLLLLPRFPECVISFSAKESYKWVKQFYSFLYFLGPTEPP